MNGSKKNWKSRSNSRGKRHFLKSLFTRSKLYLTVAATIKMLKTQTTLQIIQIIKKRRLLNNKRDDLTSKLNRFQKVIKRKTTRFRFKSKKILRFLSKQRRARIRWGRSLKSRKKSIRGRDLTR